MGRPDRRLVSTDDQVGIPVPAEVRRPGAGAVPHGKRLAPVHAEASRPAPKDEAVIVGDLRHDQVEPAIAVQVDEEDPARILVHDALVFEADALRSAGVEAVLSAVEDDDIRIIESAKDEVQVSVPVQVRATDPVGPHGRQAHVRFASESPFRVVIHVGPRILADRVLGGVCQDQVGHPVVVQVASERFHRAPPRHFLAAFGVKPVGTAVIDADGDVAPQVPAELVDENGLRKRIVRCAGHADQQHPPGVMGLEDARRRQPVPAPAVRQGFRCIAFRRMGLTDYDFGQAVPVQVPDGRIAGISAGDRRAVLIVVPALVPVVVQPRTLLPALAVLAGHDQVASSVPGQVARGGGEGVSAGKPDRRPGRPSPFEGHEIDRIGPCDEYMGHTPDPEHGDQRHGRIDLLGIAVEVLVSLVSLVSLVRSIRRVDIDGDVG